MIHILLLMVQHLVWQKYWDFLRYWTDGCFDTWLKWYKMVCMDSISDVSEICKNCVGVLLSTQQVSEWPELLWPDWWTHLAWKSLESMYPSFLLRRVKKGDLLKPGASLTLHYGSMPIVFSQTLQQQGIHREATLTSTWQVKHRDRSLASYFLFFCWQGFFEIHNTYLKIKRVSEINILQTRGLKFEAPKSWRSLHREAHRTGKPGSLAVCLYTHLRAERMALPSWNAGVRMVFRYVWEVLCVLQNKGSSNKGSVNFASINELSCTFKTLLKILRFWIFMPLATLVEWNWTKDKISQSSQGNGFLSTLDSSWTLKIYALLCIIWGLLKSVAPLETLCCFTWIACHNAGRLQGILNQSYYP